MAPQQRYSGGPAASRQAIWQAAGLMKHLSQNKVTGGGKAEETADVNLWSPQAHTEDEEDKRIQPIERRVFFSFLTRE